MAPHYLALLALLPLALASPDSATDMDLAVEAAPLDEMGLSHHAPFHRMHKH